MRKVLWGWIGWFIFLFVLDFVIPFRFLNAYPRVSGSFLFWTIWVLVAMASMFLMFTRWIDPEKNRKEA
jgi:hypothetical protein